MGGMGICGRTLDHQDAGVCCLLYCDIALLRRLFLSLRWSHVLLSKDAPVTTVLRRTFVAFAIALALVAIAAVPGMASATFSAAVDLSASGRDAGSPQVAVGPDGATTITWERSNGTNDIIQAATRPAGSATFSAAVDLSEAGRNAEQPQVAVGPDGATTIMWERSNGTNWIIQTATRPAGSATFSAAVNLSAPGRDAEQPQVAVGPDGATTITWFRSNGANWIIQAATRPAGSATFSAAVNLSAPSRNAFDPQVAVGPDGATTITWRRSNRAGNSIIQAATRPAGSATFSAAVNLSAPSRSTYDPQVAVGPDGATAITWRRYNGANDIIQAATGSAPGSVDTWG